MVAILFFLCLVLIRYLYKEKIKCSLALLTNENAISDYNCSWPADSVPVYKDFLPFSLSFFYITKSLLDTSNTSFKLYSLYA
jgi:hypothetical protein